MKITNKLNLPAALVEAVRNDPYNPGDSDATVTGLIDPPQLRVLAKAHWSEIEEDVSDRLWALYGQAVHAILERQQSQAIKEKRLFLTVEGWKVSGQFDHLVITPSGILSDYKLTSVWAVMHGVKPEWERQLNSLDLLTYENGYPNNKGLEIVALLRDWRKAEARRNPDYPQTQAKVVHVPKWRHGDQFFYLHERVKLHQAAEAGKIPPCTDEERWAKPTKFAVMKKGRKSAVRLLDTREEAADFCFTRGLPSSTHSIEERPGGFTRCEDGYCPVADFCPQFQAERQAEAA
jgi:hypothetical protein